jgi:hypothetical protein
MPELTITLCHSRLYPPVKDFGFGFRRMETEKEFIAPYKWEKGKIFGLICTSAPLNPPPSPPLTHHEVFHSVSQKMFVNYRVAAIFPEHFQSFTVTLKIIFLKNSSAPNRLSCVPKHK